MGPSRGSSNLPLGAFYIDRSSLSSIRLDLMPSVRLDLEAPFTAERSSLSPLQLIAKASSAALELAETGDMEPALKVLTQLAKIWK